MCIITLTGSCCMITVKFNESCAFQSFHLYTKLSLLFFWGFLQGKYRKMVRSVVFSMLGCRSGENRQQEYSASSFLLLYILITYGSSLVWKMGFSGVYPEESGYIGSKKKKREKIQHIIIDLLSAICENSFTDEINPTKNRSGKY